MTMPDAATPPAASEVHRWSLSQDTQLRTLRAALHEVLAEQCLIDDERDADIADDVVLVATELAANALQHGLPPTTIRLLRTDNRFILDVADHDPDTVPQVAAASLSRARGRGLFIARAVALEIGWYVIGTAKHVWAAFPIAHH